MKILKASLLAVVMVASAVFGAFAPQAAKAEWAPEVLASSALVRFEAQVVNYDATTNKYKYKFSWLMPARRTYSFLIDGKMYMNVTTNGVVETPYWFSPDVSYTIQIYNSANGRGSRVGDGRFTAPSVAAPAPIDTPSLTYEEEILLVEEYADNAPKLPRGVAKSVADTNAIGELFRATEDIDTIGNLMPYISAQSQEMFKRTPLFVRELDMAAQQNSGMTKDDKLKIYKGKNYAILSYKYRSSEAEKWESGKLFFVKENGQWKYDFVQLMKDVINSYR